MDVLAVIGAGLVIILASGAFSGVVANYVSSRVAKRIGEQESDDRDKQLAFEKQKWERGQFEKEKAERQELYDNTMGALEATAENLRLTMLRVQYAGHEHVDKIPRTEPGFLLKFPPLGRLIIEWGSYNKDAAGALTKLSQHVTAHYKWQDEVTSGPDHEIDVEDWEKRSQKMLDMIRSVERGLTAAHNGKWEEHEKEVRERLEAVAKVASDEADQGSTETPKPED